MSEDLDLERVIVHGRTFQKISLDDRIYLAPIANDDREEERLSVQHQIVYRLLGDSLVSPHIPLDDPSKILDCGYGGGDWCVQCAEEFEDCEVTGVDIYPMLVADQPDNLTLCGFNLNDRLRDPEVFKLRAYDLIHSQFISPGIQANRWSSLLQDMKLLLRPGGWVQMIEYYPLIQSDSGQLTDESAVRRWWASYESSMGRLQRDPRIGRRFKDLLIQNGYRDVAVDVQHLPIGGWHSDATKAAIGRDSVAMIGDLLESLGIWPFTTDLGWTEAQFDQLMREVRAELQNPELKLYIQVDIARGRRSRG